jgi:hypothetical protein
VYPNNNEKENEFVCDHVPGYFQRNAIHMDVLLKLKAEDY